MSSPPTSLKYEDFLQLPGEIRNQIYAQITQNWIRTVDISQACTTATTATSTSQEETNPRTLLSPLPGVVYASRQVYEELLPLFVAKTRFILHTMQDIAHLDSFLQTTDTHDRVRDLAFPRYSLMLDETSEQGQDVAFGACKALTNLVISLSTESLIPFICRDASDDHAMAVDLAGLVHAWALDSLWELPCLEKFRMECRIGPGQRMLLPMFNALAELLMAGWEVEVESEVKEVRRQSVSLAGVVGQCDLVIFAFGIVRK